MLDQWFLPLIQQGRHLGCCSVFEYVEQNESSDVDVHQETKPFVFIYVCVSGLNKQIQHVNQWALGGLEVLDVEQSQSQASSWPLFIPT